MEQHCYMLDEWVLGSWWIHIKWPYFFNSELERSRWNKSHYLKCPLFHIHHFFSLESMEHSFSTYSSKKMLCTGEKKFPYIQVIRGKRYRVKTGVFTCWQGYSNKWRTHKILIITPSIQGNPTAILSNGLQDINKPNLYLRNVPGLAFSIVFVTRFYKYSKSFIPKYFILNDLLGKNHFLGF